MVLRILLLFLMTSSLATTTSKGDSDGIQATFDQSLRSQELGDSIFNPPTVIDTTISFVIDYEYYSISTIEEIESKINLLIEGINAIFSRSYINFTVKIDRLIYFTNNTYSQSVFPTTVDEYGRYDIFNTLDELEIYIQSTDFFKNSDFVHLFTGKDLGYFGSNYFGIGNRFIDDPLIKPKPYAVLEHWFSGTSDLTFFAQNLGLNLGMNFGLADGCVDNGYIMDTATIIPLEYSTCSIAIVEQFVPSIFNDGANPVIEGKVAVSVEFGEKSDTLMWELTDFRPGHYSVIIDGISEIINVKWINHTLVEYSSAEFDLGLHNITIVVSDATFRFTVFTTMLSVEDTTIPKITLLDDNFVFTEGDVEGFLKWQVFDLNPGIIRIWINEETLGAIYEWDTRDISISFPIWTFGDGVYSIELQVLDLSGNQASYFLDLIIHENAVNGTTGTTVTIISEIHDTTTTKIVETETTTSVITDTVTLDLNSNQTITETITETSSVYVSYFTLIGIIALPLIRKKKR